MLLSGMDLWGFVWYGLASIFFMVALLCFWQGFDNREWAGIEARIGCGNESLDLALTAQEQFRTGWSALVLAIAVAGIRYYFFEG